MINGDRNSLDNTRTLAVVSHKTSVMNITWHIQKRPSHNRMWLGMSVCRPSIYEPCGSCCSGFFGRKLTRASGEDRAAVPPTVGPIKTTINCVLLYLPGIHHVVCKGLPSQAHPSCLAKAFRINLLLFTAMVYPSRAFGHSRNCHCIPFIKVHVRRFHTQGIFRHQCNHLVYKLCSRK